MDNIVLHKAATRGHANHGWLDTYHYFSFANYYQPDRVHFGALRVINDDLVKGGYGFGKHPHDNMEIITIVLEGALEHQDSMGHTQSIHPNEVQVMSAGTGIFHSEYNHNKNQDVKLFQIWIFPETHNVTPRYEQTVFDANQRINALQTLVSPMGHPDKGLKIHQQAWIHRITLEADNVINIPLHSTNHGLYILMADGTATANGQALHKRDGMGIWAVNEVQISANSTADIILLEVPMLLPH